MVLLLYYTFKLFHRVTDESWIISAATLEV